MRTLNRPMFNMGGPIKQGIMHGIREPKKNGGKMLLAGQHPKEFQDKSGREQHWAPLLGIGAAAMRFLPAAYRGFKAARAYKPWSQNLGWAKRAKDMFAPSSGIGIRMGAPGEGAGFRLGSLMRSNPITSLSLAPQAGALGYSAAKGTLKSIPGLAKGYVEAILPGDQSGWWKDKEAPTGVPLNPNLQKEIAAAKELSSEKKKEFALQQRNTRVEKYLEMMGYDRAKKTAIADALIDASKIVGDRGTLDLKNIGQEMISPIIQATSKRLDKPEQIREAVGLMATKAEIEKDLEDPSIKALRLEQLKELRGGFEKDIGAFILSAKGTKVKPDALERYARIKANEYGIDFTKITDETVTNAAGTTEEEKIQNVVGDDGIYMIGDAIIKVTGGIPKHIG